ncbi:hypothetical protein [Paenibacillus sp. NPDC058071]|uniref:hypothetical protein n=1 Tax=Paenibacillus sp. NPDC058071 TaxID=3346326 RepID=UPI0036DB53D2
MGEYSMNERSWRADYLKSDISLDELGTASAVEYIKKVHEYARRAGTKQKVQLMVEQLVEEAKDDYEFMAILLTLGELSKDSLNMVIRQKLEYYIDGNGPESG